VVVANNLEVVGSGSRRHRRKASTWRSGILVGAASSGLGSVVQVGRAEGEDFIAFIIGVDDPSQVFVRVEFGSVEEAASFRERLMDRSLGRHHSEGPSHGR
jgi:hypothetical protein